MPQHHTAHLTVNGCKVDLRDLKRDHPTDPAVMDMLNRAECKLPLEFGAVADYPRKAIQNPAKKLFESVCAAPAELSEGRRRLRSIGAPARQNSTS